MGANFTGLLKLNALIKREGTDQSVVGSTNWRKKTRDDAGFCIVG
jgi:hypothetical protein